MANLPPGPVYPVEDSKLPGFEQPPPALQPLPPRGLLPLATFSGAPSRPRDARARGLGHFGDPLPH